MVQWLGLGTLTAGTWDCSLFGEQRWSKPLGRGQKQKRKKAHSLCKSVLFSTCGYISDLKTVQRLLFILWRKTWGMFFILRIKHTLLSMAWKTLQDLPKQAEPSTLVLPHPSPFLSLLHSLTKWPVIPRKCLIPFIWYFQFSSVAQSCPTLCDPMNRSTPGLPVHHQLL